MNILDDLKRNIRIGNIWIYNDSSKKDLFKVLRFLDCDKKFRGDAVYYRVENAEWLTESTLGLNKISISVTLLKYLIHNISDIIESTNNNIKLPNFNQLVLAKGEDNLWYKVRFITYDVTNNTYICSPTKNDIYITGAARISKFKEIKIIKLVKKSDIAKAMGVDDFDDLEIED